jgi:hypothetical protein
MNKAYFVWIPLTLVFNFITCWIAVRYNQTSFLKNYLLMVAISWIPTWSLASYVSKNLIFDGMLYNTIMIVSSPLIMMYLGQANKFSNLNYVGVFFTIVGLYLIKR